MMLESYAVCLFFHTFAHNYDSLVIILSSLSWYAELNTYYGIYRNSKYNFQ